MKIPRILYKNHERKFLIFCCLTNVVLSIRCSWIDHFRKME